MKKIAIVLLTVMLSGVLGILPGVVAFAAPVISNIEESGITENTAVISWTTDIASTGEVRFGVAPDSDPYTFTVVSIGGVGTTHLANLTGLLANTTYEYVIAADDGTETISAEGSFTTKAFTISGVSSSSITENSATITWNTNVLATSNVEYGLTTAYGSNSPVPADATEDSVVHSVVLGGLTPDTLYHYKVVSTNGVNTEESVDYTFQTLDSAAPVISNVGPTGAILTTTSATVTWDTDQAANSQVEYGLVTAVHGGYTSTTALDATLVASHSVLLGGLTPNTPYFYRVISTNTYGDQAVSSEYTFTTDADTTQPVISGVASSSITSSSATITWTTDENADSLVYYDTISPAVAPETPSKTDATLVTSHQIILTGLTPNTTYYYKVSSTDAYTNAAVTFDYTFDTLVDNTEPVISNVSPDGQVVAIDGSATITWDTNEPASSQISWGIAEGELNTTTTLNPDLVINHSVAISGLSDGTTYYFQIQSLDSSGNPVQSAVLSFATLNAPANPIKTTASSDNTPTFTWAAIAGVSEFEIRIDGGAWVSVGDVVTYTLGSDAADGEHTFEVRAIDSFGDPGDITLLPFSIDATAPAAVTGLARTSAGNVNTPQFSWTAATDAGSGVSYYQIKIGDGEWITIANVLTHTLTTALVDEGTYTLSVRAVDAAGNFGVEATLDFVFDTVEPTAPANVTITTGGRDTTPTFTWDAATDVTAGVVSYEVRIGTGEFADVGNVFTYTVADGDALVAGSYTFEVRAVDAAGNRSPVGSVAFQISGGGLPVWVIILIVIGAVAGAAGVFFWVRRSAKFPKKS